MLKTLQFLGSDPSYHIHENDLNHDDVSEIFLRISGGRGSLQMSCGETMFFTVFTQYSSSLQTIRKKQKFKK